MTTKNTLDLDALESVLAAMGPPWLSAETKWLVHFREEIIALVNAAPAMLAEIRRLRIERDELLDAAGLACECPPAGCDCAGCLYGKERANAG